MRSWKTTATGLLAIVIAVATALKALWDNDPSTTPDWNAVAVAIMAGIGLLLARDNDKSSEDVGIKGKSTKGKDK